MISANTNNRQCRLQCFLASRPYHLLQFYARTLDETPQGSALGRLHHDRHRQSESDEHAQGAQRRRKVRVVVVAENAADQDGTREQQFQRIQQWIFSFHV